MKKIKMFLVASLIAVFTLVQTGCIGSFTLTKNIHEFNTSLDNPFVQEVVFLAFLIIPVYDVGIFVDALILNTIEFWTGDNPLASKTVINEEGKEIEITKTKNQIIMNEKGTENKLIMEYDKKTKVVSMITKEGKAELVKYNDKTKSAIVLMPDGLSKQIELNGKTSLELRNKMVKNMEYVLR
ncbi:DUF3332 domain-containing protein [Bacteroidota bacterium]